MRKTMLLAAMLALTVLMMAAAPAMANDKNDRHHNNWNNNDRHHNNWNNNHHDKRFFNDHDKRFFNDFRFNDHDKRFSNDFRDDCEWEFEEGWFWGHWGWQWGTWVLDC